ncbi:hypothetical protein [Fodinibacter luteus]|uniref:hypothetical protein n=1 Tax=Fodinibacter luteus TaxID=552064 RepID=UPI0031E85E04
MHALVLGREEREVEPQADGEREQPGPDGEQGQAGPDPRAGEPVGGRVRAGVR